MFIAAVPAAERRRRLFERRRAKTHYCAQDGLNFYLLELPLRKKQPDYSPLQELYPRFGGRVVAAQTLCLPAELEGLCFCSHPYEQRLMLRLCAQISERLPFPLIRRTLGIVDPAGIYPQFAETLIKYSPTVKVYTHHPQAYALVCEHLLEHYGAPLILTENAASLAECRLLFVPDAEDAPREQSGDTLAVLGTRPPDAQTPNRLVLCDLALSAEQRALVPNGIEPIGFYAAACELSGKKEFLSLRPGLLQAGCRRLTPSQLSLYIRDYFAGA